MTGIQKWLGVAIIISFIGFGIYVMWILKSDVSTGILELHRKMVVLVSIVLGVLVMIWMLIAVFAGSGKWWQFVIAVMLFFVWLWFYPTVTALLFKAHHEVSRKGEQVAILTPLEDHYVQVGDPIKIRPVEGNPPVKVPCPNRKCLIRIDGQIKWVGIDASGNKVDRSAPPTGNCDIAIPDTGLPTTTGKTCAGAAVISTIDPEQNPGTPFTSYEELGWWHPRGDNIWVKINLAPNVIGYSARNFTVTSWIPK